MPTDHQQQLSVLSYLAHRPDDQSIYQAIGVEPVINCRGTFTIIGGSVERPEVLQAMHAAAGFFVQYDELATAVGERLAQVTGAEWGLIASGCAAAMKHVTAACVTGGNPEKLIRIPDLSGLDKTEVIVPRYSRTSYDHALRNIGIQIVMVDTAEELARAINPRTAMIYIVTGRGSDAGQPLSLETIAAIAAPAGIPILADAAAEDLTIPPVHLERGASVVTYSGGKALCGPQCAGLALGRKDLLMAAWQASAPHHGPGRDDKVGKEEILGMLAAVEAWVTRDHQAEWQTWLSWLEHIAAQLDGIPSVATRVEEPAGLSNRAPVLVVSWDPAALHITGEEVAEDFARNKPRIAVGNADTEEQAGIRISPNQMQPGNDAVVAERLHRILTKTRPPRAAAPGAAAVDLSGRWDLTVQYFTSVSQQRLFIQQDGNWIEGVHQSEYSVQDLAGVIDGEQVKLRSHVRQPGDSIPFLFAGTVEGDTMSGSIHLGEYLTATFSAVRSRGHGPRQPISIPNGPPLAT